MLRTLQRNSNISAYKDMEGPFDWNNTPLAPRGCKAVVYSERSERASWAPHARDAFYIGRAPLHYRLKHFYMCDTHGITTAVGKLYPAHCKTPSISESDLTISAATDLVKSMRGTVPAKATKKQQHTEILKKLLSILENSKPPRVVNGGQMRVSPAASTLANATSPRVVATTRFLHQHQAHNNIPLPSIREEDDVTETTPVRQVQDQDSLANARRDEGDNPIPYYVEDVQEVLWAISAVQQVKQVRMNMVRR